MCELSQQRFIQCLAAFLCGNNTSKSVILMHGSFISRTHIYYYVAHHSHVTEDESLIVKAANTLFTEMRSNN